MMGNLARDVAVIGIGQIPSDDFQYFLLITVLFLSTCENLKTRADVNVSLNFQTAIFPELPLWRMIVSPSGTVQAPGFPSDMITLFFEENVQGKMEELGLEIITMGNQEMPQSWLGTPMMIGERVIGVIRSVDVFHELASLLE